MKKIFLLGSFLLVLAGCNDEKFLDKEPTNILNDAQVWQSPTLVLTVLADLYDRYPDLQSVEKWAEYANFDEAFASAASEYWRSRNSEYPYDWWNYWDYGLLRELNLFIQKCEASKLTEKSLFLAEARYLRASVYFELVKRMGGVPLILEPMEYNFSGDPTYLQHARAKESEIYDFVIAEMEAIKADLPAAASTKSRATKGLALATEARAALYAASIAKYGVNTPEVSLPGGEIGIPAALAAGYYQKALKAAEELIAGGQYALYLKKPTDLQDNFASLFTDKSNNPEVIFVKDFKLKSGKIQGWTLNNQPRSSAEEQQGGRINPSLNLVQSFEKLDNTFEPFATKDAGGNYLYFNNPLDLFANRDARLGGTVILPGSQFKAKTLDIWAGYMLADGSIITGDNFGARKVLPGKTTDDQVVGFDGPIDGLEYSAQTGFYVRKFMDPAVGSGQIGTQSDVWWVRYRYAEVLLNAAEAAFELGDKAKAAGYLNPVRRRAGFQTDLVAADITFDRLVHERKVELAFEGHLLWDMKRWRLAHVVWNGASTPLTTQPGKATETSTRMFGLWPYKVYAPGAATNGRWVFRQIIPANVTNPHRFRLGNYYSLISEEIRNNNPKIVKNPNQ
ncbi:RagB/SusD family nutrient uptake outer membrane protein [Siphonobacter aquaeclarae]|uniref:Starch-binding associating with outer membrane n=1 Tax=Siphonobacter aquaeclarae TaxID=563176 RepID=A0A1G9R510_9BACT|nr:RagB/SusD family nutrient uptake outer membrane protein [Siphonobacter aquaeclarae]SDM17515.1 Starch-binding associating with outer membrane [Siphonobacter aquaeclarae]